MATELLQTCDFALTKIKKLYMSSRQLSGDVISFPIEYDTISGSSDSIVRVNVFDADAGYCIIGGQTLEIIEISVFSEFMTFTEEYQENKQGKTYVKRLEFQLPLVNYTANAALKEFLFTAEGQFAVCKAVAFIEDENSQLWIVGERIPLILQSGMELGISTENYYKLSFQSINYNRTRNYQIQA